MLEPYLGNMCLAYLGRDYDAYYLEVWLVSLMDVAWDLSIWTAWSRVHYMGLYYLLTTRLTG